jgi:hypothetical protein
LFWNTLAPLPLKPKLTATPPVVGSGVACGLEIWLPVRNGSSRLRVARRLHDHRAGWHEYDS